MYDGTEGEVFACAGDGGGQFGGFSFGILGLGFGGFGNIFQTIQNLLGEFVPLDSCPAGTFECPTDGSPLFGTPTCDPMFCTNDGQASVGPGPADSKQQYCSQQARYAAENELTGGFAYTVLDNAHEIDHRFGDSPEDSIKDAAKGALEGQAADVALEIEEAKELGIARLAHKATRFIKQGAEIFDHALKVLDLAFAANAYDNRFAACMNYMNGVQ